MSWHDAIFTGVSSVILKISRPMATWVINTFFEFTGIVSSQMGWNHDIVTTGLLVQDKQWRGRSLVWELCLQVRCLDGFLIDNQFFTHFCKTFSVLFSNVFCVWKNISYTNQYV